jgi:hypothetical protein
MFLFVVDALADRTEALVLNGNNVQAYLRKGISLYNLNRKNEAIGSFFTWS